MIKTILVVDDDPLIRDSLAQALEDNGFTVSEASDGEEGLDKALHDQPDLILTDIVMPKLDGVSMVEQLRRDSWGTQARVIILTNDASAVSVNQSLEAGVTLYYFKPMTSADELIKHITDWAS